MMASVMKENSGDVFDQLGVLVLEEEHIKLVWKHCYRKKMQWPFFPLALGNLSFIKASQWRKISYGTSYSGH